eukprot:TRINITY_DN6080_c0_g1_i2.p1 TRINITY_DN6080_c0_g1~~TRINITY_DN6080_c0_g1_i2.p1  ORF type:complete len:417 (+),score=83.21 TRINITY_DN6080_c0_g1_i2:64-1251(+)
MGAKPSTQEDLLCLKSQAATLEKRQAAFERLRQTLTKSLHPAELLKAVAAVDSQRFDPLWQKPDSSATTLDAITLADRVRGCIFGAALGDAAGLAAEFLSPSQVADYYGESPDFTPGREVFPDEHRMMWCRGDWTDDTDQQILILQTLLNCGGRPNPKDFAARILAWRRNGFPDLGQTTKAVLNDPRYLEDPHATAARHSAETPSNGGVMRTAVVGIPQFWDEVAVAESASSFCRTTHADPRCVASSVAVAVCISRLLRGLDRDGSGTSLGVVKPALERARTYMADEAAAEEMETHATAETLEALKLDEQRRIGYTFKCLGAGFWALSSSNSFRDALNAVIKCGGDADTNGTVAGALLGCRLGYSNLPADWIAGMPYSSWLEAHAQKVLFMLGLR